MLQKANHDTQGGFDSNIHHFAVYECFGYRGGCIEMIAVCRTYTVAQAFEVRLRDTFELLKEAIFPECLMFHVVFGIGEYQDPSRIRYSLEN